MNPPTLMGNFKKDLAHLFKPNLIIWQCQDNLPAADTDLSQNPECTKAMCPRGQKSCFGAKNNNVLCETKVFATRQKLTWFLMKLDMHY